MESAVLLNSAFLDKVTVKIKSYFPEGQKKAWEIIEKVIALSGTRQTSQYSPLRNREITTVDYIAEFVYSFIPTANLCIIWQLQPDNTTRYHMLLFWPQPTPPQNKPSSKMPLACIVGLM